MILQSIVDQWIEHRAQWWAEEHWNPGQSQLLFVLREINVSRNVPSSRKSAQEMPSWHQNHLEFIFWAFIVLAVVVVVVVVVVALWKWGKGRKILCPCFYFVLNVLHVWGIECTGRELVSWLAWKRKGGVSIIAAVISHASFPEFLRVISHVIIPHYDSEAGHDSGLGRWNFPEHRTSIQ
jgi:hypothetical protein